LIEACQIALDKRPGPRRNGICTTNHARVGTSPGPLRDHETVCTNRCDFHGDNTGSNPVGDASTESTR
jgi:hypothetical protein